MADVMVFKTGTLKSSDKSRLTKNGVCWVEVPFPGDVRNFESLKPDFTWEMLLAAMEGLASGPSETSGGSLTTAGKQRERFFHDFKLRVQRMLGKS